MITRDEFHEKFPRFLQVPAAPQCRACFTTSYYHVFSESIGEMVLQLHERHRATCEFRFYDGQISDIDTWTVKYP